VCGTAIRWQPISMKYEVVCLTANYGSEVDTGRRSARWHMKYMKFYLVWSDTECEEIVTLAGWCRVLSSQCTLKSTWSGSTKGKYAWTFDYLFFLTDGLRRDVDAGVLIMYASLPAGDEFSSVFTCFPLLGVCVCLWEMVWCGVYILFFVFFCFCYCCYSLYHSVPLRSFSLKFCIFLGRIGMQAYGLLLSM